MTFKEERERQKKQEEQELRELLQRKQKALETDLANIDLARDCRTPYVYFETEIHLRHPSTVKLTDDERIEALEMTERFYQKKGIALPQGLIDLRQILTKPNGQSL